MSLDQRGVLYPARLPTFNRLPAPEAVADLVRWFWIPEWRIAPGRTSRQHLIAFPACNLVVEEGLVGLSGPTTRRSYRDLSGTGWAVGALLRPAAVPLFTREPGQLRDAYRVLDLPELRTRVAAAMSGAAGGADRAEGAGKADDAGDSGEARDSGKADGARDSGRTDGAGDYGAARRHRGAVDAFAGWLAAAAGRPDPEALLANTLVDVVDTDPQVLHVADIATRLHVSTRTVQRLARRYVGLPPLTMIRRRRLQEAAQRLRTDPTAGLTQIAAQLGYSDQAHLAAEFRTVLGFTPSSYRGATADAGPAGTPEPGPERPEPEPG